MASLRDVLNHIGRPVRIERDGVLVVEVKGIEKAGVALVEPKAEPLMGDTIRFLQTGKTARVQSVAAEAINGKIDHYRLGLEPA